jgi:hypothetical protein
VIPSALRPVAGAFCLALSAAGVTTFAAPAPQSVPSPRISVFSPGIEAILREQGVEVWARKGSFVLGRASDAATAALEARGVVPLQEIADDGSWIYLLHHRPGFVAPVVAGASIYPLTSGTDLYLFPKGVPVVLPRVKPNGAFQGVPRLPLPPVTPHPADLAPQSSAVSAASPLISQILANTSQAIWYQDVKDLSGENPVTIGGTDWTILTRYSDAMFPTPADNAHATEYLEDRGAGWGYTSHREDYTSAESGCGQANTWQNLIFIVPGQVDFGQHQQVLFVNHYDSLSFSDAESRSYAPGADDAISGGSALLEAMRTFKDFAFKNTIVFAWFSGEEEGICGSGAYVHQHPTYDMWRVVNMDQTAYDGDGDRLMDVYNWDSVNSPASVGIGDTFVQANSDYGNIIDPTKIVRDTSEMCQTDHCPFWDVGVPAIAVTEDLHNNDINPCFDQSQTPTCHDTVTQVLNAQPLFLPDFSWPSEKVAIATIATMAQPLYACPASPVAAPATISRNNAVDLSWGAAPGVTNYVVERAASCAGPFDGIASVTGTSFEDATAVNGTTYAYRIRTCPTQTSDCVTETPSAAPSVTYEDGSASITADSGDHDLIADNCELVTVSLHLINDGNVPLTGVRLASVTPSTPAARVATALPQVVGSLGVGATATVGFKFYLGRNGTSAACGDALTFTVVATSDQSSATTRPFTLIAERTTVAGPLTFSFDGSYSGWTVVNGAVNLAAGGAPGSTTGSLHFRQGMSSDCDAVQSPIIKPTATTTMTMYVNYIIQSGSTDRANVRAVDTKTGEKILLTPTGATYNTNGDVQLLCDDMGHVRGWSGSFSTWRQATFDLSPLSGREIRLDARYSSDGFFNGSQGFWMDAMNVTNATQINCDAQTDTCAALPPEVSPPGAAVPFTISKSGLTNLQLQFSQSTGATKYNVYPGSLANLQHGIYDHASAAGLCGFTDSNQNDGVVNATVAASAIPDNSYLLAVASSAVGESKYGSSSSGQDIPIALNACP